MRTVERYCSNDNNNNSNHKHSPPTKSFPIKSP